MPFKVEIRIDPHPDTVPPDVFDRLMDGELVEFERWFLEQQRRGGNPNPSGLISAEKAMVKTYALYLATKTGE